MIFDSQTNILILTEAGIESGGVVRVRGRNQDHFNSETKPDQVKFYKRQFLAILTSYIKIYLRH